MGQTAQEEEEYFTISWRKLIAISGFIMLIGIIMMLVGYRMGSQASMLVTDGMETSAVVIGTSAVQRRGSSGTTSTTEYSVRYRFSIGNERYLDRKIVSRSFYESVETGDSVPVRYLLSDPSINEIEPGRARMVSRIVMGIGVLFVLSGVGILFLPRKVRKPARAIAGTGKDGISS